MIDRGTPHEDLPDDLEVGDRVAVTYTSNNSWNRITRRGGVTKVSDRTIKFQADRQDDDQRTVVATHTCPGGDDRYLRITTIKRTSDNNIADWRHLAEINTRRDDVTVQVID